MTPEEFGRLTIPQITQLLGDGKKTPEEWDEERQDHAFDHLERMCRTNHVTPEDMALQSDATLERWARDVAPSEAKGGPVDVKILRDDLKAFIEDAKAEQRQA